jgi:hypothetical protein
MKPHQSHSKHEGRRTQADDLDEIRGFTSTLAHRIGDDVLERWGLLRPKLLTIIAGARGRKGRPSEGQADAFRLIAAEVAAGRDPGTAEFKRGLATALHTSRRQAGRWIDQWELKNGHK